MRDAGDPPRATRVADHFHIGWVSPTRRGMMRPTCEPDVSKVRKSWPPRPQRRPAVVGASTCCGRAGNISPDRAWGFASAPAFHADGWDELECAWTLKEMRETSAYTSADRASRRSRTRGLATLGPAPSTSPSGLRTASQDPGAPGNPVAARLAGPLGSTTGLTDGRPPGGGINRIIEADVKRQGFG